MSNFSTNDNRSMTNNANLQGAKVDNSITYVRGLSDEALTSSLSSIGSMVNSITNANLEAVRAVQQKDLVSETIKAKMNQQAIDNTINTTNKAINNAINTTNKAINTTNNAINSSNRNLGNIASSALSKLETGSKKIMSLIIAIAGIGAVLWIANKKGLLK
uniref:Uncharacterized protein n=1 Tax=uncultured prokaryote TaxID=198431 RepID=A0A0H5QCE3_9ZZZZ|nr:hypothetical protein [uncultured prokaryote]